MIDILLAGNSDSLNILNAETMETLTGGDEKCRRNYSDAHTRCKRGYEAKDNGEVNCARRYQGTTATTFLP